MRAFLYSVVLVMVLGAGLALVAQNTARTVSLVVSNGTIVTMDAGGRVVTSGAIAIDAGAIVAVDRIDVVRQRFRGRDTIDARGGVVLPGLINTHTHAPM